MLSQIRMRLVTDNFWTLSNVNDCENNNYFFLLKEKVTENILENKLKIFPFISWDVKTKFKRKKSRTNLYENGSISLQPDT